MKLYDVTSWNPSMRKKFEKELPIYAEGATYRNHYIVTFATELEMYKKIDKGITDNCGKLLNIQCKKVKKIKSKKIDSKKGVIA